MNKLVLGVLALVFLSACDQGDKELKELKSKRAELNKKLAEMNEELDSINSRIARIQKIDVQESITPYTIAAQSFQHTISIQSNVTTEQDVMLYPEYAGSITWNVKEGQHVAKGQIIGSINDGGMSSQLQQVKIQADLAKAAFDKQSRLWKDNIGSEIQYLQAKTNYDASLKSISAIQSQLSRTKVKAPFSGTIDNLIMQSGQAVAPGVPIAKLVSLGNLKVTADVSEQYMSRIKVGTLANIELASLNKNIQGRVARLSNSINPNNRTFSLEIPINNADNQIKPNMSAKVNLIDYQNPNAIAIPNSAIQTNAAGDKYVYTITNINKKTGKATKSMLKIGESNSEYSEVLSGLRIGDIIIKEGSKSVVDKSLVKF
jgi:membrane fusion protein (multidrug efflux system)